MKSIILSGKKYKLLIQGDTKNEGWLGGSRQKGDQLRYRRNWIGCGRLIDNTTNEERFFSFFTKGIKGDVGDGQKLKDLFDDFVKITGISEKAKIVNPERIFDWLGEEIAKIIDLEKSKENSFPVIHLMPPVVPGDFFVGHGFIQEPGKTIGLNFSA